jgi:hypothetical protein
MKVVLPYAVVWLEFRALLGFSMLEVGGMQAPCCEVSLMKLLFLSESAIYS